MSRLPVAIAQVQFVRDYTNHALDQTEASAWFMMPTPPVTHIAWQVGHLAIAEYRLLVDRIRGVLPEDEKIIPSLYFDKFGKGSTPNADPGFYPSIENIRTTFDRVHQLSLEVLSSLAETDLDQPPLKPHPLFNTKLQSIYWFGHHEMSHTGQIGLLRRLRGNDPWW